MSEPVADVPGPVPSQSSGARVLLALASLVVLVAGLQAAEAVVVPLLLSAFIAMLAMPSVSWLRQRRLPDPLPLVVVLLAFLVLIAALGAVVGGSVNAFTQALPQYQTRLDRLLSSTEAQLAAWNLDLELARLSAFIDPGQILELAGGLLSRLAGIVSNFLLVFLTVIFILTEASGFPAKVQAAFGDASDKLLQFASVMTQVHHYLIIKTAVSLATGLLLGIWVWMLGVDFPVLWGLLAFLLNYVPNIGSIMAAVPPVLVALIQPEGGPGLSLLVAIGYVVVNIGIGNFVEPGLMGQRLGLSTLVVFLSLVFWGWVWGGVGMLLSVPLTMVVKILLQNSEEFRWVAVLLDKSPRGVA